MINGEKVLIVATMKNEGPYILEWVAHHHITDAEVKRRT